MNANEAVHNTLPEWWLQFQRNVMMPGFIFAKAVILFNLFTLGLVPNINNPLTWGWLGGTQVVARGFIGFACAGIDISCAIMMVWALNRKRFGLFLGMLFGLVLFAGGEILGTAIEVAGHLPPNPVDSTVAQWVSWWPPSVTITMIAVAVLPNIASIFAGFTAAPPVTESESDIAHKHRVELENAKHKAAMREIGAKGWATAAGAGLQAIKSQVSGDKGAEFALANDGSADDAAAPVTEGEEGSVSGSKHRSPLRFQARQTPLKGRVTASELVTWVSESLGEEITQAEALAFVKAQPNSGPTEGIQGRPVSAPKAQTLAAAKRRWGQAPQSAVSGG